MPCLTSRAIECGKLMMRSAFAGDRSFGLMALNAVSAGASFAMTSLLLAPLGEQINHASNREDCPCGDGQEPCLSAPHFAFPPMAPSTRARAWLKFETPCSNSAPNPGVVECSPQSPRAGCIADDGACRRLPRSSPWVAIIFRSCLLSARGRSMPITFEKSPKTKRGTNEK